MSVKILCFVYFCCQHSGEKLTQRPEDSGRYLDNRLMLYRDHVQGVTEYYEEMNKPPIIFEAPSNSTAQSIYEELWNKISHLDEGNKSFFATEILFVLFCYSRA